MDIPQSILDEALRRVRKISQTRRQQTGKGIPVSEAMQLMFAEGVEYGAIVEQSRRGLSATSRAYTRPSSIGDASGGGQWRMDPIQEPQVHSYAIGERGLSLAEGLGRNLQLEAYKAALMKSQETAAKLATPEERAKRDLARIHAAEFDRLMQRTPDDSRFGWRDPRGEE
jgi:hypothetical protein